MHVGKKKVRDEFRKPVTFLFITGAVLAVIYLYYSALPVALSVVLALAVLAVTGMIVSSANGFPNSFGLYIAGGRRGIGIIERLSKRDKWFWESFSEWGAVLSFGLLSYLIFRKKISRKVLAFGILCLLTIMLVVSQNLQLALAFITIPKIGTLGGSVAFQAPSLAMPPVYYLLVAVVVASGFLVYLLFLLVLNAAEILFSIGVAVFSSVAGHPNTAVLSQQLPGVLPLIPGITLPFFAGILALAVVLIVHEFSHGVLARRFGVRIKKIGLILFGVIPLGAFVEPDERRVSRLDKEAQDKIFIAGISANFLFMFVFFVLTVVMVLYVMPSFFRQGIVVVSTAPGYPAFNAIAPGSEILGWDGHRISNISSFLSAAGNETPFSTVSVLTEKGGYTFHTNATGRIGIGVREAMIAKRPGLQNGIANFFYSFFALAFALNFLVAIINLLPIPAFDGWRIYKNRIRSKKVLRALSLLTIALLLILALPLVWLFA